MESVFYGFETLNLNKMTNRDLAERIYEDLNKRGADLGNASIGIICKTLDDNGVKNCSIPNVIDSATLIKQQLELIDQKILVQIVYESGFWCYVLHRLPSEEDIKFAESGECQDGDLWKRAERLNNDWYMQEQESFLEALTNGIEEAKHYL